MSRETQYIIVTCVLLTLCQSRPQTPTQNQDAPQQITLQAGPLQEIGNIDNVGFCELFNVCF